MYNINSSKTKYYKMYHKCYERKFHSCKTLPRKYEINYTFLLQSQRYIEYNVGEFETRWKPISGHFNVIELCSSASLRGWKAHPPQIVKIVYNIKTVIKLS